MTHIHTKIQPFIAPGRRVHLAGIGGVSMNPLAEVLHQMGLAVQGSDQSESPAVERLRHMGVHVSIGHDAGNIRGAEFLIRTAAIHDDNPEIAAAHAAGLPVFERAEAWGAIMQRYENAICIAGTHGKTTTTAMTTHFFPTVAVVLNVEEDHLDFFTGGLPEIKESFRKFAQLVPPEGRIVANADAPGAMDALRGLPLFTFGRSETADCRAENLTWEHGRPEFDVVVDGRLYTHLALHVAGEHNLSNALAAASAAYVLGIPGRAVKLGLEGFFGAGRRFECKGQCRGAKIYDDYAHHPAELHALLEMTRSLGYDRVICAFQPHTYSRTKALFADFVRELKKADLAVLTDIFAAREKNTAGVSSRDLAAEIPGALYCPSLQEAEQCLMDLARPGDLILTVGAGDIYTVGEALARHG